MSTVLVTGGAGYIGSHVVYALLDAGFGVVVLDNLSTGVRQNLPEDLSFVEGDIGDKPLVAKTLREHGVSAVMHFAGSIVVPESVTNPIKYYRNNVAQTLELIDACTDSGVGQFVFSSTAAVYGQPDAVPIAESAEKAPINPYGSSKLMIEQVLKDVSHAFDFRHVALRYFNVAGADPDGRTGQSTPEATHLIKVAVQAALGMRDRLEIYGTDYPTPDGTCIRDYIHVSDLAAAHVAALRYLESGGDSTTLNCGYGHGFSVKEVIETVKEVTDVDFEVRDAPRRDGDPPELISNASAIGNTFEWAPQLDDLKKIVADAYRWEQGL